MSLGQISSARVVLVANTTNPFWNLQTLSAVARKFVATTNRACGLLNLSNQQGYTISLYKEITFVPCSRIQVQVIYRLIIYGIFRRKASSSTENRRDTDTYEDLPSCTSTLATVEPIGTAKSVMDTIKIKQLYKILTALVDLLDFIQKHPGKQLCTTTTLEDTNSESNDNT
ncbi:hypothetical protein OS493_017052 [Desmophyllum pertusum]|uniref:Uncharacterized protein n=1 Tax=Desmophyllum pertusum TaxID=174260 RepID=A0A9W9YC47_9CNID|nr:hypothetical protein OS493_017052 [Desmophyllum pertusum]